MKNLFFICLFLTWSSFVSAQLQDSHFYKVDDSEISSPFKVKSFWKSRIEGSWLSNSAKGDRERLMKVKLYGDFDAAWNSSVSLRFEPYLVLSEGEQQYRRFTKAEPSSIQMRNGYLHIKPIEGMSLQAGAINQDFLNAPLLVSDHTFLSALAGYLHIKDNYEVQVIVQQAMPSVVNTFRRYSEVARPPYFSTLFTYAEWLPSTQYSFKGHLAGFYFSELPSFIAHNSKLYGNTIEGSQSVARFMHSYYGMDMDISSQIKIHPRVYLSAGYNGILNMGAPLDKAWGERIYTSLDVKLFSWVRMFSKVEYFHNRSDSAPAYFNSEVYGHNNRKGFLVEIKTFFPKGNFEAGFRHVLSTPAQPVGRGFLASDRQHSFQFFISSRYKAI